MLKSEDFFDLSQTRFKNLFEDTEYVWDTLKKLKKYIGENIRPKVSELRKKGEILIGKTLVLYDDKTIESGFDIRILKKKLVVEKDGEFLDGASVIYAGTLLMDNEIYIGKGTIVETGGLIKGPEIIGDKTE